MKKNLSFIALILCCQPIFAQLNMEAGVQWIISGNTVVTIQDLDFINNGNFTGGNSLVKFTGNSDNNIGGGSITAFYDLEISKAASKKMYLQSNIILDHELNFTSGLFDLNQKTLTLAGTAFLNNENENSRMTGLNGGEAIITLNLNAPNNINPGNLGAVITSALDLGSVIIKRGHKMQTGTGLSSSISRYFDIQPTNNTNLNATLRIKYFDAELNQQNENSMIMFRSADNGINWTNQSINSFDAAANFVEKTGISSFSKWTLSSAATAPLPILGLQFYAKRISNDKVQLNWESIQEINNLGFHIERKKETDNDFVSAGFVNSAAPNGNSSFPLEYSKIDTNSFTGKTFYRLKQEDIDGHYTYSVIRVVNGEINKTITLKAWPIPAPGDFNILVQGIDRNDMIQVIDVNGKLLQQVQVSDNVQQKVNRLPPGVYFLRLANNKDVQQKIIVQ